MELFTGDAWYSFSKRTILLRIRLVNFSILTNKIKSRIFKMMSFWKTHSGLWATYVHYLAYIIMHTSLFYKIWKPVIQFGCVSKIDHWNDFKIYIFHVNKHWKTADKKTPAIRIEGYFWSPFSVFLINQRLLLVISQILVITFKHLS